MLRHAATMRRQPTEPERLLWMALRDRRLLGHKFRRQAIIGSRIVDFHCPAKNVAVEVDGESHDRTADLMRDETLERQAGCVVVRFTNREVMDNLDGVLLALSIVLQERPDRWPCQPATTPQPPPLKRRGSAMSGRT